MFEIDVQKMSTADYAFHVIWHIGFFPLARVGLFIIAGFQGALSIFCFDPILFIFRYEPLP